MSGQWQETLINGSRGFRFLLSQQDRSWELELQPLLGPAQGVTIPCQPDFILRCDEPGVRPVAIFTDGFEAHVHPNEPESRLTDDVCKRRAILDTGQYWVWSLNWDDLKDDELEAQLAFIQPHIVERILPAQRNSLTQRGLVSPAISQLSANPWRQLQAFVLAPVGESWKSLANHVAGFSLVMLAGRGIGTDLAGIATAAEQWQYGYSISPLDEASKGDWCWFNRLGVTEDLLMYAPVDQELMANRFERMRIALRLDDRESQRSQVNSYRRIWRSFHALLNLFQFSAGLAIFTTSEAAAGTAPSMQFVTGESVSSDWQEIIEEVVSSLEPLARAMAHADCVVPELEYYSDDLSDLFAELAWPGIERPTALLVGDQGAFAEQWQNAGWVVSTDKEITAKGHQWMIGLLPKVTEEQD